MPLLRSRMAVRRARFKAVVWLFASFAMTLAVFVVLVAIAYVWNHA